MRDCWSTWASKQEGISYYLSSSLTLPLISQPSISLSFPASFSKLIGRFVKIGHYFCFALPSIPLSVHLYPQPVFHLVSLQSSACGLHLCRTKMKWRWTASWLIRVRSSWLNTPSGHLCLVRPYKTSLMTVLESAQASTSVLQLMGCD